MSPQRKNPGSAARASSTSPNAERHSTPDWRPGGGGTAAYERIVDALRSQGSTVKETGARQASATCPAHDDRRPSLSITGIEGRTLIYCHAGCETPEVLAALGLRSSDLFDSPRGQSYDYPDGRKVHRSTDKKFRQSGNTKGNSLFRADRVGDARTIYVVEGEQDVLAIESAGGTAVSPAMGAGKASRFDWTPLEGRGVVIVADKDEPGRHHAAEVARLLKPVAAAVKIVEAKSGKDAADHIASGHGLDEFVAVDWHDTDDDADDAQGLQTVPWPTLSPAALHGSAGEIVRLVEPHTEADPAAILAQLLAELGAAVGPGPHFVAANDRHCAVINPLVVGRTADGAKGTSLAVVEAIRRRALPWFDAFCTSGLSSAEGLIEAVRDPSGNTGDKDYDEGVVDKRLLVHEAEYKSVLVRSRREGSTLGQILRDAFDGRTLRTLTRRRNRLTATGAHIVVIGHITPAEFRSALQDSDLSGGSINRTLIVLSRRSRLHPRLGNIPDEALDAAAALFAYAYEAAVARGQMPFTDRFWARWDDAYLDLNRDRPDSRATEATARATVIVLRLALLYALFDRVAAIDVEHLQAALALWDYGDRSARWIFSTHEQEAQRETAGGLARYIRDGGPDGRTRTEINKEFFKGSKTHAEIKAQLTPLVHDGTVVEVRDDTGGRSATRYIHRNARKNGLTEKASQGLAEGSCGPEKRKKEPPETGLNPTFSGDNPCPKTPFDQGFPLIRFSGRREEESCTNPDPPGGVTDRTPGLTDCVASASANAHRNPRPCVHCCEPVTLGQVDPAGRPAHLGCQQGAEEHAPEPRLGGVS